MTAREGNEKTMMTGRGDHARAVEGMRMTIAKRTESDANAVAETTAVIRRTVKIAGDVVEDAKSHLDANPKRAASRVAKGTRLPPTLRIVTATVVVVAVVRKPKPKRLSTKGSWPN